MTIQRLHQDERYLTYMLYSQDMQDFMDVHHATHDGGIPGRYGERWKTLNIKFVDMAENGASKIPDLSFDIDHLFLNKRAFKVLKPLLFDHGEFLPVNHDGNKGYFFNALKIAEDMDALLEELVGFDEHGNLEHFAFDESKINGTPFFKAEIDSYSGSFCTQKFIDMVTEEKLTGLQFYPDVSNVIGGAYPIMQ